MRRALGIVRAAPPALWALLATVVVVVAVSANWLIPWLTRDTYVRVATPVPPANFGLAPIPLERGKPVCINDVLMPSATQVVGLGGASGANRHPPAIEATVTAPGYRSTATIERGWPRGLVFDVASPPSDVLAQICLTTRTRHAVLLNGTTGPVVRATTTVDGKPQPAVVSVELRRSGSVTRLSQLGTMIDRAMDFSWRPLSGGVGRVLAALVLLLVPIGAAGALLWTMEADRRRSRGDGTGEDVPALTTYHDGP